VSVLKLEGFELLERVGEGGMATVWKARQLSLDRIVAIKILQTKLARDPGDVQRFQAEAQAAARLKHPGIVQVYDARSEDGLYYFVMEYVEGYTVGQWLRRKGTIPEKDTLLVADCVADALQYAWNKERIIHCDIKPENVMVDADGTVKVADLGLARTITAMTAATPADEITGTPAYMSPEQARGDAVLDFRTDIYSLGATLYHMLTGHMLFEGLPEDQVMQMQISGVAPDPLDLNPRLSSSVCWLLEKMLAKDPQNRHESWESVRADLDRVKRHLPPLVKGLPEGRSTIQRSPRRRKADYGRRVCENRTPSIIGTLVPLLIAALVVSAVFYLRLKKGPIEIQVNRASNTNLVAGRSGDLPKTPSPRFPAGSADRPENGVRVEKPPESQAAEMLMVALKWIREHPGEYDEATRRLEKVLVFAQGTPQAVAASNEIQRLRAEKAAAVSKVLGELKLQAEQLAAEDKFEEAIAVYSNYLGKFAAETSADRKQAVQELQARRQQMEDERLRSEWQRVQNLARVKQAVAAAVAEGRLGAAAEIVAEAMENTALRADLPALARLKTTLERAAALNAQVLASLRQQIGSEVTVSLNTGRMKLLITDVKGDVVEGIQERNIGSAVARRKFVFRVDDLTLQERLARADAEDTPQGYLLMGLAALQARAYDTARQHFESVDPLITEELIAAVETMADSTRKER